MDPEKRIAALEGKVQELRRMTEPFEVRIEAEEVKKQFSAQGGKT